MAPKLGFFKPKAAATSDLATLELVVVAVSDDEGIGAATGLAKRVGLKDMRAAGDEVIQSVLGVSKAEASLASISGNHAEKVLAVVSETLQDSEDHLKTLESGGVRVERLSFAPGAGAAEASTPVAKAAAPTAKPSQGAKGLVNKGAEAEGSKGTLGIVIKKDGGDFGMWYQDVLKKGDMIDYYDISGCYILKPASFGIWEVIQRWFDDRIKEMGVENAYFPMFVSNTVLQREKDHIEGFAPEVAWVTRAGQSDLEVPIAIRPTSETVMYPYYAKWIQSHRDLPLRLNQWNSVVRWEFKNPQPFLRTREFLWQEGHTAHLHKKDADAEVLEILDYYRRVYEELLAVPVTPGVKSEKEKFAGGLYSTTVEGFIPTSGRGIQGGTSHCLGQNFSKMFNITVEDPAKSSTKEGAPTPKLHVWQNSWGLSTRTIGVMVMIHGDDKGLVIPPRVAQTQVVVVPVGITASSTAEQREEIYDKVDEMAKTLRRAGVKAKADLREGYTPGWKFNDWEMKGVPLRLELGPKDISKQSTQAVRRDDGSKSSMPLASLAEDVPKLLVQIQKDMYDRAKVVYDERRRVIRDWKDFVPALNSNCSCVIPWCERESCEDIIKEQSAKESAVEQDERAPSAGAKSLCIPFDQERWGSFEPGTKCVGYKCDAEAKKWCLFGRSY